MHIQDVKLTHNWTSLAIYTAVDVDATYQIVNNSPDVIYAVEGDDIPNELVIGVVVNPSDYIMYQPGEQANLYLKNGFTPVADGMGKLSNITINKVG